MTTADHNGTPIRVIVVDDHDLFRTGLASLLSAQPEIEVAAQASGGRMGVRLAAELQPDVVLMDIRMDDLSGIEATRQIIQGYPAIRVLALTVASSEAEIVAILRAGASGFLAKDTEMDSVVAAIHAAVGGTAWLSPSAAHVVLGQIRMTTVEEPPDPRRIGALSSREREVLSLIAAGKENSEIAELLNISPRTVKNHVSSILTKLDVPSRVQAAVYAVRHGVS
ncbi:MAG TPA: response regulator transcription factor [Solirubrobacteraceae bacterium]|nr:response regulator transcription factor [Solirubrobacteraceae bacterium]